MGYNNIMYNQFKELFKKDGWTINSIFHTQTYKYTKKSSTVRYNLGYENDQSLSIFSNNKLVIIKTNLGDFKWWVDDIQIFYDINVEPKIYFDSIEKVFEYIVG
mgnify:CR=1 FL=1